MRIFDIGRAADQYVRAIRVARWEQYGLDGELPFQAMWYTVPPGDETPLDEHPELELSLVVAGTAHVSAGGQVREVGQGSVFLLDSTEQHVVQNRSADQPLTIFSAYWHPLGAQTDADQVVAAGHE